MKTKNAVLAVLCITTALCGAPVFAQQKQPQAGGARTGISALMPQIDALQKETMDEEVMYWAWRITTVKDVSYAQMESNVQRWIMTKETKALFLEKLKNTVDSGKSRPLTAEERKKYEANKARIRNLLAPGRTDESLQASLSVDYCIDLESRYFARRIKEGEAGILQNMERWNMKEDTRKRLAAAIEEKRKTENAPLTQDESYKMDACIEKLSSK